MVSDRTLGVMNHIPSLPRAYKALAARRSMSAPDGYLQPECFGYEFREWVSPYTKGACTPGYVMLILQDWASERALSDGINPDIAALGRDPRRRTNLRLEQLLMEVLGFSLRDVYATNVFPFVKPGCMSAPVPQDLVNKMAEVFTAKEVVIAKPMLVITLGAVAHRALHALKIKHIPVPHPAARIGGIESHKTAWVAALAGTADDA